MWYAELPYAQISFGQELEAYVELVVGGIVE